MPPKLSEVELLLNKAALHQARLREALGFKQEVVNDAELRRQEEELFKCEPEFAGVGYRAKDDPAAELKRKAVSSDDRLRRQLLGIDSKTTGVAKVVQKGPSKYNTALRDSDSDDDEDGRSAAFKSKRRKLVTKAKASVSSSSLDPNDSRDESNVILEDQQPLSTISKDKGSEASEKTDLSRSTATKPQKRATQSYLDELLAQKAKKRKKHKKNKGGDGDDSKV